MDLDQSRNFGFEISQGILEHFAVIGVLGGLELLKHMLAGEHEALLFPLGDELRRGKRDAGFGGGRCRLGLLFLDRFAFPAQRHMEIIFGGSGSWLMGPARGATWLTENGEKLSMQRSRRKPLDAENAEESGPRESSN
jgi:hypothetical protein